MNSSNGATFSCRFCQNYQMEGRRGGTCQILNVFVQSDWESCPLAIRYFAREQLPLKEIPNESKISEIYDKVLPLKSHELASTLPVRKVS